MVFRLIREKSAGVYMAHRPSKEQINNGLEVVGGVAAGSWLNDAR